MLNRIDTAAVKGTSPSMELLALNRQLRESLLSHHEENAGNEILGKDDSLAQGFLRQMHVADIASFLETLEPELRAVVWQLLGSDVLISVIEDMNEPSAIAMVGEIPDPLLANGLKAATDVEDVERVLRCLAPKRRAEMLLLAGLSSDVQLLKSLSFAPDTVGEIMDFEHYCLIADSSVGDALASLRKRGELSSHTDKLFITEQQKLVGILPLKRLLVHAERTPVSDIMVKQRLHTLTPEISINEAIKFFERYDLVSAPVLNYDNEVLGRVTIDEILGNLHEERHSELLSSSGLKDEEDLYAPIWTRLQNRGFWVFINLVAAFLVSRMIGTFEGTILQIVALASLMPIVASMAGNTAMQTATIVIRALALNQVGLRNWHFLLIRELALGIVNGLLWGFMVGLFGFLFYQDVQLALVLTASMFAVFVMGAGIGFLVPVIVNLLRKDPALGTVVIVTTLTDCLGFFVFLGLATIYLV